MLYKERNIFVLIIFIDIIRNVNRVWIVKRSKVKNIWIINDGRFSTQRYAEQYREKKRINEFSHNGQFLFYYFLLSRNYLL